ncbi:helix-turn-helix domain-containing protein [Tumebacillus lipolyticus]|uniref:Helix-turn-helix domain-containing protein n=1 Tax=Tumebacillus lipolyticus TaxID=1280370 RepID=A0ABW4ZZ84_9BACL
MNGKQTFEQLLKEKNLNLQKVSEETGVSTLALEFLLQNQHLPKPHIAQKLAKLLGLKVGDIWPELGR